MTDSERPRIYSEDRQQQWLSEIFGDFIGCAVDVGANDGVFYSNTLRLEQCGWKVLCIEANADYQRDLERRELVEICAASNVDTGSAPFMVHTASPAAESSLIMAPGIGVKVVTVPLRTVDSLLDQFGFTSLDLISVDVEGTEIQVLEGCNIPRWKPKAIIAEFVRQPALRHYLEGLSYRFSEQIRDDYCFLRVED